MELVLFVVMLVPICLGIYGNILYYYKELRTKWG